MIQYLMPTPVLALAGMVVLTVCAWRGQPRTWLHRLRHLLTLASLWAWVCCTPALANRWVMALEGSPLNASTASPTVEAQQGEGRHHIIVLGSGQLWLPDGRPAPRLNESGWERLQGGVKLWREIGGQLIFTGGPGPASEPTLAGAMGEFARQLGVPAANIGLAVSSRNTYEDILAAKALIGDAPGKVWIVTSALHMPRTLATARQAGLSAVAHPVDFRQIRNVTWRAWIPDNAAPARMSAALHEAVGRWVYRSKGWAD